MKILQVNNKHLEKPKPEPAEYGCVCGQCGTVFIFNNSEVAIPRMINYKPEDCTISCPNCSKYISLKYCRKFKNNDEKNVFENQYDE